MSDTESVPSTKLAKILVDRLILEGFIRANNRKTLIQKIASGEMDGDDWKLEIELATAKASKP